MRAIFCPRNEDVDDMYAIVVARLGGDRRTFLSHDQLEDTSEDTMNVPIEFLNSLTVSFLPPYPLILAVGSCIVLIRNLDTKHGLCNGTTLVVINMNDYVIDAKIITGSYKGEGPTFQGLSCCLLRLTSPSPSVGDSQTFDRISIYLPNPVFSHWQLYVALSRAKSFDSVSVLAKQSSAIILPRDHKKKKVTLNVVYPEALH
ncbi:hypothetical protein PR048_001319 [Dryococelus australis]|uniref:DNA helicase Pif1-like 2B domain-containing protein n=1 Tax=Dryococelus australis TaxID=614101 RepID=A0ABQ9IH20_9NEOP|nr:hypothetical protein PR048_001319 [Dryococelus australis]